MNRTRSALVSIILAAVTGSAASATITTFSNRVAFTAATGATTVEDFTASFAFPIATGILNSATSGCCAVGTIHAGDIKAGVTYSTPIKAGNFFNIDAGGGYVGGFLDTVSGPAVLTVTFDGLQSGFGFDANSLMGAFVVTINDSAGLIYSSNFGPAAGLDFFGFQNSSATIKSLTIASTGGGTFGFALDNFTFDASRTGSVAAVPEPASWAMMLAGFGGLGLALRRRRSAPSRVAA